MKRFLQVVLVLLLMSVITGVVFAVVFDRLQVTDATSPTVVQTPKETPPVEVVTETRIVFEEGSIPEVVQSIRDSVVIVRKEVQSFEGHKFREQDRASSTRKTMRRFTLLQMLML